MEMLKKSNEDLLALSGSGDGSNTMEEGYSCSLAMMNPLVLDNIFSKMGILELKSARSMCKVWEEVGSAALAKKAQLNVKKMLPCCTILAEIPPFSIKLARHLKVPSSRCVCLDQTKQWEWSPNINPAAELNFLKVAAHVESVCEEIEVCAYQSLAAPLLQVLVEHGFPKLKSIRVNLIIDEVQERHLTMKYPEFQVRLNLKSLNFRLLGKNDNGIDTAECNNAGFNTILQSLINSAPNLEELINTNNTCPDLTKCTKLRVLDFVYFVNYKDETTIGDSSALNGMIEQVKNSVVKMTLGFKELAPTADEFPLSEVEKIRFPTMPHLRTLSIGAVDVFPIHKFLDLTRFPKLEHLHLSLRLYFHYLEPELSDHFGNLQKSHNGIQSLTLDANGFALLELELGTRIARFFPNVKKFKLNMENVFDDEGVILENLKTVIATFGCWNLTHGELHLESLENKIPLMVAELEGVSAWKGLKKVQITITPDYCSLTPITEFSDLWKSAFLSCSTFESVHLYRVKFQDDIKEEVDAFIALNNLPITTSEGEKPID